MAHARHAMKQPAPVLHHERDAREVQPLDERDQRVAVAREGIEAFVRRLVGAAEPEEVGRDDARAARQKRRQHAPVEIAPRRLAVQAQERALARPLVDVREPQPGEAGEVLDVARRAGKTGQRGEALLGRAEDLQGVPRLAGTPW